ncbi:sodium:solute symporter family protein [Reichenbachiella sp. MSK19-1]|uniref:sodium:solute symporter family protein n=1 Tax=Reichenbachiella sp. MSK19-1 TaxID=1897631 RepID=UPI000E6D4F3C|nr:sodium:solute symporter family protein [Reichenbachiella sp. MSK19-1]RJE72479.1 sodium transporter [Reichenbachiella sp. MSK19-1]
MGVLDLGVILVFTILVFACGMSFFRSGKSVQSFFAAGGALPWWMSGLSLFMSFFSAGTFVVWGSIAYSSGWVAVMIQWTMCLAGVLVALFVAPRWQRTRALTAAAYITGRFGQEVQKVYTYLFLLISMFTTGAFLYPVAKIVEVSTGLPIYTSIIFLGVLILIYTAVGGLWAVIVTDVLQFVVLSAAVIIMVPLSLDRVGGLSGFVELAPADFFALTSGEYTWGFLLAFGLYNLFFIAGNWAYVQRYVSVSSPREAKKVGWLFSGLYLISPIIWMLPPMIFRVINPSLDGLADEGAYMLISKAVMPAGMLGLMLGGMVFATSSSVNTTLNVSASVIVNDLYRYLFPQADNSQLVKVGRISTVLLGIITIIVALLVPYMGGIVQVVMGLAAVTGGAMFLPPLWSLFSKRIMGSNALLVTVISLLINAFLKFIMPLITELSLSLTQEMVVGVGLPVVLLLINEVWSRREAMPAVVFNENTTEAGEINIIDEEDEEKTDDNNRYGQRVIGTGVAAIGLLIVLLSVQTSTAVLLVGGTGLTVMVLGSVVFLKNLD